MSAAKEQVVGWLAAVSRSMADANSEDDRAYQRLDGASRWERVQAVCRDATRFLNRKQLERIERQVESDHERFGTLMREIRARLGG